MILKKSSSSFSSALHINEELLCPTCSGLAGVSVTLLLGKSWKCFEGVKSYDIFKLTFFFVLFKVKMYIFYKRVNDLIIAFQTHRDHRSSSC